MKKMFLYAILMAIPIVGAVLAFEFGWVWLTLILVLLSIFPGFKFHQAHLQYLKEQNTFCEMRCFYGVVRIHGYRVGVSPMCPRGEEGSGLWDVDYPEDRDAHCTIRTDCEERARAMILENIEKFDNYDEEFYAKDIEIISVMLDTFDDGTEEEIFDIEYE